MEISPSFAELQEVCIRRFLLFSSKLFLFSLGYYANLKRTPILTLGLELSQNHLFVTVLVKVPLAAML